MISGGGHCWRPPVGASQRSQSESEATGEAKYPSCVLPLILGLSVLVVVLTIGLPLVGTRTFHASDILHQFAPWHDLPGPDERVTNPLLTDTVDSVIPQRFEFRQRAAAGDFPLWSDLASGGTTLGAVPSSGMLSPLNLPYWVMPMWYAPAVGKLLEMVVAITFTFLFLRRVGLSRPAAVFAGLVFVNSGFQVVWSNWPHSHVGALIPAFFWAIERSLQVKTLRSLLPIALVTATALLEGFPVIFGYTLLVAAPYVVLRVLSQRARARLALRRVLVIGGGVALGLGLAAVQVLPFLDRVGALDLAYRQQTPGLNLGVPALVTLVAPNALGSPMHGNYWGRPLHNYVETQSFVGASTLLLVLICLACWGRSNNRINHVMSYFLTVSGVLFIATYWGGPVLDVLQETPLFGQSFVGRVRSVLGFSLACLAGMGLDLLVSGAVASRLRQRSSWIYGLVAVATAIAVYGGWRLWVGASARGQLSYTLRWTAIPLVAGAVTAALIVSSLRQPARRQYVGYLVVPAVLCVESLAFALPYLPRVPTSLFYPETAAHEFLRANIGAQRFVSQDSAMYPNSSNMFGLRSVTGHVGPQSSWRDLLMTVFPKVYPSPTFSVFPILSGASASPIMDRLAVKYLVDPPDAPVIGTPRIVNPAVGAVTLEAGVPVSIPLRHSGVRGVAVMLTEPVGDFQGEAYLDVVVRSSSGQILDRATRRIRTRDHGQFTIPFALEVGGVAEGDPLLAELILRGNCDRIVVASDEREQPSVTVVNTQDDGLRLVFDEGAAIYERVRAQPRIRWASAAQVVDEPQARLSALARGVDAATVLLHDEGPPPDGAPATVHVLEDGGDTIRLRVDAEGAGYLVVADAMQRGWSARLDGKKTELRPADHALVAVAVPSGQHDVLLSFDPPSFGRGLAVTAVSLVLMVFVAAAPALVRRWRRGRDVEPG